MELQVPGNQGSMKTRLELISLGAGAHNLLRVYVYRVKRRLKLVVRG
jgi:hypothetical protein